MAFVIKSLKEKFPDIYELLLKNQKTQNLIFFGPNGQLYARDSLKDKSFYYNHIFQKSKFDPSLYTNFYGKVLKSISEKTFKTYLGWSLEMTINIIESNYNEDGLFFYQTDGICIEEYSQASKVKTDETSITIKRCLTSNEYLEYYSKYDLPLYTNFQKGINSMKSFIFSINNNFLLIKGHEEYYSKIFIQNINQFISAFEIIFKNNSIVAREFVDSYIFSNLYDKIMKKLDSFYQNEQKELKPKLDNNIEKYGIDELKLDNCLLKCTFNETFENLENLKNFKTSYEKSNCLIQINDAMIKEAKTVYEDEYEKKFEVQGDILLELWTYILAQYMHKNGVNFIYLEYLFFKYFKIGKGYEQNDYIIQNLVGSMEIIQNELLKVDNNVEQKPSTKPFKVFIFQ